MFSEEKLEQNEKKQRAAGGADEDSHLVLALPVHVPGDPPVRDEALPVACSATSKALHHCI